MPNDHVSEYQTGAIIQAYFGARLNARGAYTAALRRFWENVASWLDFAWQECDRHGYATYLRTGKNPLTNQVEPTPENAARGEELQRNTLLAYYRCMVPQLRAELHALKGSATALVNNCQLESWSKQLSAKHTQPVTLIKHVLQDTVKAEKLLSQEQPDETPHHDQD